MSNMRCVKVVKGSNGQYYNIWYDKENDEFYCDCISYLTRRKCRHIEEVKGEIMALCLDNIDEVKENAIKEMPSSLNCINEMFESPLYNNSEIVGLYALANTGKSFFILQEIAYLESLGYNILYIDTEGSALKMITKNLPMFRERFGGNKRGKIYLEEKRTLKELMKYFGYNFEIVKKSKETKVGRLETNYHELKNCEFEEFVKKNKIDFVVIDSITNVIRAEIPSDVQNNPTKSFVEGRLMSKLVDVQGKYNVCVCVILHASMNPSNVYDTTVQMRGGFATRHNLKRLIYIEKPAKKDYKDIRLFWLVRSEFCAEWSRVEFAKVDRNGFYEIDEDKEVLIENILSNSRKERLQ